MRTTLTLDDDLAKLLQAEVHRQRSSFKEVVNDTLRRGLRNPGRPRRKYRAPSFHAELAPGVDPVGFNRFADDLETDAVTASLRR